MGGAHPTGSLPLTSGIVRRGRGADQALSRDGPDSGPYEDTTQDIKRTKTGIVLLLGAVVGLFAGCLDNPGAEESLTIATAWTEAERAESNGRSGAGSRTARAAPGRPRIDWIVLAAADDPARLGNRSTWVPDPLDLAPDILLGGPVSGYRRLARADRLATADPARPETWFVAGRSPLGWAMSAKAAGDTARRPGLSFDDPRRDPIALAWASRRLGAGSWSEGYAAPGPRGRLPPANRPGARLVARGG